MFSRFAHILARRFIAPTFTRRRSFAGSLLLTCQQTGETYSILTVGPVGFYAAGEGGRLLGSVSNYTEAFALIEADAREAIRAFPLAA